MPRIAVLGLALLLTGCGYDTWWNAPFSTGTNPHLPVQTGENMQRAMGMTGNVQPLTPEPGDVWPGPLPIAPTLQDIENTTGAVPQAEQPQIGSPLQMQGPLGSATSVSPPPLPPRMGSSSPPNANPVGMPPLPSQLPPAGAIPSGSSLAGPAPPVQGQTLPTQKGPAVISGGTNAYQTVTTPGGGNAIMVPNGNGTSTIIHPNGTVETVPTPK